MDPGALPASGALGDWDEAALCADLLWPAWAAHPAALEWLQEGTLPRDDDERERLRRAFESIHPEGLGGAPAPPWLRSLALANDGVPDCLVRFAGGHRSETAPWLVVLVKECRGGDADETALAASNAAALLAMLGPPEAVPALAEDFERAEDPEAQDRLASVLSHLGAPAAEALIAAHAGTISPEERALAARALSRAGVHDPRILEILLEEFGRDRTRGLLLLASYRDPASLPALSAALDDQEVDESEPHRMDCIVVRTLRRAIEAFGGTLTAAQIAKADLAESLCPLGESDEEDVDVLAIDGAEDGDLFHHGVDDDGEGRPVRPLVASGRPGRNEPCWCGSGKRDKRCHLAEDDM